ncbi:hypothetical protein [Halorientalis halophila]|uniref:hypothetical protein n=1 Tax=Halorientalis halophila TaxID=3108499 RepID=UPI003008BA1C
MAAETPHGADAGRSDGDASGPTRRRLLGALGAGVAAGLGGCIGGVDGRRTGADDRRIERSFTVVTGAGTSELRYEIPAAAYESAREAAPAVPAAVRAARSAAFLDGLAERLQELTASPAGAVRAARSLTARLPYVTDVASTGDREYVRHPAETLVDGRGDCDDVAVLLMALLSRPAFGYRTGLVMPRNHCATLVARDDLPTEPVRDPLTVSPGDTEFVYVEAVQRVRAGDWARAYGERPVLAAYLDGWHVLDGRALLDSVGAELDRATIGSLGRYV